MNREDIIRMAREADLNVHDPAIELLQRFADHVAKHTLANIDPSSFMSWQEGYEAGAFAEREACAKIADENAAYWAGYKIANAIRARGQT